MPHTITRDELIDWMGEERWTTFASSFGDGSNKRLDVELGLDPNQFRVIDHDGLVYLGIHETAAIAAYNAAP